MLRMIDRIKVYAGLASKINFSDSNPSLDGIKIGKTSYKVIPCGKASGNYSTATGFYSTASGVNSTASGYYSTASGFYSTASGFYSTASGVNSTASGVYSTASGYGSIASGSYSTASIGHEYSILSHESNLPSTSTPTFATNSIDKVFFANLSDGETAWTSYTSFSQFAKGHYLSEYLGAGKVTVVNVSTTDLMANASAYFDVTGTGTSADPFIVTPKTSYDVPHSNRLYKIALDATGDYYQFHQANNEKCLVEFTSTATSTDVISFSNLSGTKRHGVNFIGAVGYAINLPTNTAFVALIDINSCDMWQLSD